MCKIGLTLSESWECAVYNYLWWKFILTGLCLLCHIIYIYIYVYICKTLVKCHNTPNNPWVAAFFFLSFFFIFNPRYIKVKARRMAFVFWDGQVLLINPFPSMIFGKFRQTLESKGTCILRLLSYFLTPVKDPCQVLFHGCGVRGTQFVCLQHQLLCDASPWGLSPPCSHPWAYPALPSSEDVNSCLRWQPCHRHTRVTHCCLPSGILLSNLVGSLWMSNRLWTSRRWSVHW